MIKFIREQNVKIEIDSGQNKTNYQNGSTKISYRTAK